MSFRLSSFPWLLCRSLWSGPDWQQVVFWRLLYLMKCLPYCMARRGLWRVVLHGSQRPVACGTPSSLFPVLSFPVSRTPQECPCQQNLGKSFCTLLKGRLDSWQMSSSLTTTTVSILFRFNIFLAEKEVLIAQVTAHSCVDPFAASHLGAGLCAPLKSPSICCLHLCTHRLALCCQPRGYFTENTC